MRALYSAAFLNQRGIYDLGTTLGLPKQLCQGLGTTLGLPEQLCQGLGTWGLRVQPLMSQSCFLPSWAGKHTERGWVQGVTW